MGCLFTTVLALAAMGAQNQTSGPIAFGLAEFKATGTHLRVDALTNIAGLSHEDYLIGVSGNEVQICGGDERGTMYGLLDAAEQIRLTGKVKSKQARPFLRIRGFKFNLPLSGSAYLSDEDLKNNAWFYDLDYWRAFTAMMARNRYNTLSFWSAHPYPNMVRLAKYPEACTLTDEQLAKNKAFFHRLFGLARDHGLDVYIVTWNIHMSDGFKRAHGLKDGQDSPLIRDYEKECVKELLKEYPEIAGIGTCPGEAMPGSAEFKENWIKEVYLDTQKIAPKPFILRYWGGEPTATANMLSGVYYNAPVMLDIKFNGEHMYSSTKPHVLDKRWQTQNPRPYELLWHLRNDDIYQIRWGDPDFARGVILSCGGANSAGFVMGSEVEIPGEDRNHTPEAAKHKTWKYVFEKDWMRFQLWGRLGYNPNEPESTWIGQFQERFGKQAGTDAYLDLKSVSKIIPLATSFHWNYMNGDWYPEGNIGSWNTSYEKPMTNFRDGGMWHGILAWMFNQTIDDSLQNIPDYVADQIAGRKPRSGVLTPPEVARRLLEVDPPHALLGPDRPLPKGKGEWQCTMIDWICAADLGTFYSWRVAAATELLAYLAGGDKAKHDKAVWDIEADAHQWDELAAYGDAHYKQHEVWLMGQFGWSMYKPNVAGDVETVRAMKPWPKIVQTWRWDSGDVSLFTVGWDVDAWCKANAKTAEAGRVLHQWIDRFEKRALVAPKAPDRVQRVPNPTATTAFDAPSAGAGLVRLNGRNIASVTWNGRPVPVRSANAVTFVAEFKPGANTLKVVFTKPPESAPVARFEFTSGGLLIPAASGELTTPFQAIDFPGACGKAIAVPIGAGRGEENGTVLDHGVATYTVGIPADGEYALKARGWWKNTSNNSLFWSWDDAKPQILGNDEEYGRWHWIDCKPVHLVAGRHRLVIRNRDENSVVDCFLVCPAGK